MKYTPHLERWLSRRSEGINTIRKLSK